MSGWWLFPVALSALYLLWQLLALVFRLIEIAQAD